MLGDENRDTRAEAVNLIQIIRERRRRSRQQQQQEQQQPPPPPPPRRSQRRRQQQQQQQPPLPPIPIRHFQLPDIDLNAKRYTELVDVRQAVEQGADIEPPCIMQMDEADLSQFLHTPLRIAIPCHTQSTERAVKLTTESVSAVTGPERQDGYALNKRAFRRKQNKT